MKEGMTEGGEQKGELESTTSIGSTELVPLKNRGRSFLPERTSRLAATRDQSRLKQCEAATEIPRSPLSGSPCREVLSGRKDLLPGETH